jgi:hypothetical protein
MNQRVLSQRSALEVRPRSGPRGGQQPILHPCRHPDGQRGSRSAVRSLSAPPCGLAEDGLAPGRDSRKHRFQDERALATTTRTPARAVRARDSRPAARGAGAGGAGSCARRPASRMQARMQARTSRAPHSQRKRSRSKVRFMSCAPPVQRRRRSSRPAARAVPARARTPWVGLGTTSSLKGRRRSSCSRRTGGRT